MDRRMEDSEDIEKNIDELDSVNIIFISYAINYNVDLSVY